MRKAGNGRYFYRVPSLPATNDGSAKPLAEDLSTRPGSEEDITWDAGSEPGATEADVAASATEPDADARPAQADREPGPAKLDAPPRASDRWFHRAEPDAMLTDLPALASPTATGMASRPRPARLPLSPP